MTGEKWKEVKVSFAKERKKKRRERERKNALWEKSSRARPLVNDLRVKPTAEATQPQQQKQQQQQQPPPPPPPHRSARPRA